MVRILTVLFAGSGLLAVFCMALMQYFGYAFDYYFAWLVPGSLLFGAGCGVALASRRGKQSGSPESQTSGLHWLAAAALAGVGSLLMLLYLPLGPVYLFLLLVAGVSLPYLAWAGGVRMLMAADDGYGAWFMVAIALGAVAGLLGAPAVVDIAGGPLRSAWLVCGALSVVVLAGTRKSTVAFAALAALMVVGLAAWQVNATQFSLPRWQPGSPYLAKPILGALSAGKNMSGRPLQWDSTARSDVLASLGKKKGFDWVITNGTAPVPLVSRSQSLSWLQERFPIVAIPLQVRKIQRMLSISPQPGPDVLIAQHLQIPVIDTHAWHAMGERINADTPDVAGYPALQVSGPADGPRPVENADGGRYDLIFLPVTHPANAGWAGSSADEVYLYTREAIRDYWSRLEEGGVLAVTTRDELLFVRMMQNLWAALAEEDALHGRDFVKQAWGLRLVPLAPYKGSYQFLLLAVKGAVAGGLPQQLRALAGPLPVDIVFGPGAKAVRPYDLLERSASSEAAVGKLTRFFSRRMQQHVDLAPATDQRPFFFHVLRDAHPYMKWLLTACLGILIPVWLLPLASRRRPGERDDVSYPPLPVMLGYFGLLGGLLVMVGSLLANQAGPWLLLSGAGAPVLIAALIAGLGLSGIIKVPGTWSPLLLVLILALMYPLTGLGGDVDAGHFSILRVVLLIAVSLLLGVAAAMTLRWGKRLTADAVLDDLLPWAWLVTGVTALAGSVLAYWLSMLWGWPYVWGVTVAASLLVFTAGLWMRSWLGQPQQG